MRRDAQPPVHEMLREAGRTRSRVPSRAEDGAKREDGAAPFAKTGIPLSWSRAITVGNIVGDEELALALESLHSDAVVADVVSGHMANHFDGTRDDSSVSGSDGGGGNESEDESESESGSGAESGSGGGSGGGGGGGSGGEGRDGSGGGGVRGGGGDSEKTLPALGGTFWIGAADPPRFTLERLAKSIMAFHCERIGRAPGSYERSTSGVEWWCQIRPHLDAEEGAEEGGGGGGDEHAHNIGFHFDKDEWEMAEASHAIHPILSTVTYLSGGKMMAPTVVLDRTLLQTTTLAEGEGSVGEVEYDADLSTDLIDAAFVSWPRILKHTSFDGRLLHGVPVELAGAMPPKGDHLLLTTTIPSNTVPFDTKSPSRPAARHDARERVARPSSEIRAPVSVECNRAHGQRPRAYRPRLAAAP